MEKPKMVDQYMVDYFLDGKWVEVSVGGVFPLLCEEKEAAVQLMELVMTTLRKSGYKTKVRLVKGTFQVLETRDVE